MAEIGERKLGLESITNQRLTWVNSQKPTREKLNILEESYLFHELNIEDCLSKIQIPKIDRYEDHIFVILHFPSIDKRESIPRSTQHAIICILFDLCINFFRSPSVITSIVVQYSFQTILVHI
jgi:Mg2+ and Co2+ transporter CorA